MRDVLAPCQVLGFELGPDQGDVLAVLPWILCLQPWLGWLDLRCKMMCAVKFYI